MELFSSQLHTLALKIKKKKERHSAVYLRTSCFKLHHVIHLGRMRGQRRSLTPWYKLFYYFLLPFLFGVLLLFPSLWRSLAISLMPALLLSLAVSNGAAHRAGALPSLDPWAVLRVGRARALSRSIFCS